MIERLLAPPESMILTGPDEDLGEPLYDLDGPIRGTPVGAVAEGPVVTVTASAGSSGKTRMYFFKGHTTGIAAKSVEEARRKKTRGPDELEGSRAVIPGEFGPDGKTWSRLRLDGKPPGASKHDKRGLGPAPKRR